MSRRTSTSANDRFRELGRNIEGHRKAEEEIQATAAHTARGQGDPGATRCPANGSRTHARMSLRQVTGEVSSLVSSRAYAVFLRRACKTYRDVIENMRQRGELPAGIKKQFVEDLLSRNQCICGRSLGHDGCGGCAPGGGRLAQPRGFGGCRGEGHPDGGRGSAVGVADRPVLGAA